MTHLAALFKTMEPLFFLHTSVSKLHDGEMTWLLNEKKDNIHLFSSHSCMKWANFCGNTQTSSLLINQMSKFSNENEFLSCCFLQLSEFGPVYTWKKLLTHNKCRIGLFPMFGDSHISWLRPRKLECNFGLSWFRENGKNLCKANLIQAKGRLFVQLIFRLLRHSWNPLY